MSRGDGRGVSGRASALAAAFAEMPLVLKGVTSFFAVFGAASLVLPLVPGVEQRVAGASLGAGELWGSGLGAAGLALGAWLVACAFGLLRRAAWAWVGVALAFPLLAATELALAPANAVERRPLLLGALAAVWAIATLAYRLGGRGARRYLSSAPGDR